MSLTGILLGGGRRLYESLYSRMCCATGAQGSAGEQEQWQWWNAEGTTARRSSDIYKHPATGRSNNRGNLLNECAA